MDKASDSRVGFLTINKAITVAGSEMGRKLLQADRPLVVRHQASNKAVLFCPYTKRNPKKRKPEAKCMCWVLSLSEFSTICDDGIDLFEIMELCTKHENFFEYFVSKTENGRTFYEVKLGRDTHQMDTDAKPITMTDLTAMSKAGIPLFYQNEKGEFEELPPQRR